MIAGDFIQPVSGQPAVTLSSSFTLATARGIFFFASVATEYKQILQNEDDLIQCKVLFSKDVCTYVPRMSTIIVNYESIVPAILYGLYQYLGGKGTT